MNRPKTPEEVLIESEEADPDLHVFPTDDIEMHHTDEGDRGACWCEPKETYADDGDTVIWVHNRAKDNPQ